MTKHIVALLALFILPGCGQMLSVDSLDSASKQSKKVTFNTLVEAYGRPQTTPTYKEHKIMLKPEVVRQCMIGELDMLQAVTECGEQDNLLVTVKDDHQEKVAKIIPLPPGGGQAALDAFEIDTQSIVRGENVDILVCLDANGNGKCADEAIADLNKASQTFKAQGTQGLCAQLKDGLLLYHHHEKLSVTQGTSYTVVLGYDQVTEVAQDSLVNLPMSYRPASAAAGSDNAPAEFRIPLVKSDAALCPPPPPAHLPDFQTRTDGCFAKGTMIKMSDGKSKEIEKIHVGDPVMLSDGRIARVGKILAGPEPEPVISFETIKGEKLTVTSEHPMLTTSGVKKAKLVTIGDELVLAASGKAVKLAQIRRHEYKDKVYNFELTGTDKEADHLVVANGLISGELFLQNKLIEAAKNLKLSSR